MPGNYYQWQYPSQDEPVFTPAAAAETPYAWNQPSQLPLFLVLETILGGVDFVAPPSQDPGFPIPVDRPERVFDHSHLEYTFPTGVPFVAPSADDIFKTQPIPVDRPDFVFDVEHLEYTYPSTYIVETPVAGIDDIFATRSLPVDRPDQIWDHEHLEYTFPSIDFCFNELLHRGPGPDVFADKPIPVDRPDQVFDFEHLEYTYPSAYWTWREPSAPVVFVSGNELIFTVPAGGRLFTVPAGGRTFTIPGGGRRFTVPAHDE